MIDDLKKKNLNKTKGNNSTFFTVGKMGELDFGKLTEVFRKSIFLLGFLKKQNQKEI